MKYSTDFIKQFNIMMLPSVDLLSILMLRPYEFDLKKVNKKALAKLLCDNLQREEKLSVFRRLYNIHGTKGHEELAAEFIFSEIDMKKLEFDEILFLVKKGNHVLSKKTVSSFSDTNKAILLATDEKMYLQEGYEMPKHFSMSVLSSWSCSASERYFIEKYVTNFSSISVTHDFWANMIKHNHEKYSKLFMDNLNTCQTATDIRKVFYKIPSLIKLLTPKHLESCKKLTHKEWLLLINNLKTKYVTLKDWVIPDDLSEELKMGTSFEIFNGKSKSTKHLSTALKALT